MQKYSDIIEEEMEREAESAKKLQASKKKPVKSVDQSYLILPDADFKEIDVIPGEQKLRLAEGKIRPMPEEGDLQTTHNYLDLLFRLLHEDGIQDLRNGLYTMFKQSELNLNQREYKKRIRDCQIKLHEKLSIIGISAIDGAACVQFRLPTNKKKFVDWKISKRLMPGSLIVISNDVFYTLLVGIVKNRDANEMNWTHKKFGYVPINIEILKSNTSAQTSQEIVLGYASEEFMMIESTAYFEAYKHVLKQLQEMDRWPRIPF